MVSSMSGDALVRSTKKIEPCLQSNTVVVASWSGAAWLLLVLGSCGSLRIPKCAVTFWSRRWCPPSETVFQHNTPNTAPRWQLPYWWSWRWWSGQLCIQTWTLLSTCGASSSGRWRSTMCLTSRSSVMSLWRSGRAWNSSEGTCAALVNVMPRRINTVLENNGAPTKYWHFGHSFDVFT